ncbi:MAG: divergent polysaccharide deacetylase family protein [Omnitrophica bacterium]|nr:divergent polysaccharide deacetylase family protein [Candidatus Omnitrophota bacterium]
MQKKTILILSAIIVVVVLCLVFTKGIFFKTKEPAKVKVAIIIDDWGYNLHYLKLLKEINVPITISILPNLRYSTKIAEIAKEQGKEIILHLPLEPEREGRQIGLEEHTITSDMSQDEIVTTLKLALTSVPYASGASNHMGSRATKDKRLMSAVFAELKRKKMFFLDNLVTTQSVCGELAQQMQVKFATRNVFLDNEDNQEYIKGQLDQLSEFAQEYREAVGIGHARRNTLKVLKEEIAAMQAKGIKFVFISELVQ